MSQIYKTSTGGGGGGVTSVTGANGVTASPTTGAVVVSGIDATTSSVGVASFNPNQFTVTTGEVSLIGGSGPPLLGLLPDVGGAVGPNGSGDVPTLGQKANTTPVMETYNDGAGNFRIADQTFVTQYVVDASTTVGLKGTFQTIQSAINQAVTDGTWTVNPATILIRPGSYIENLVFPAATAAIIYLLVPDNQNGAVNVSGSHTTNAAGSFLYVDGINFESGGINLTISTFTTAFFENCAMISLTSTGASSCTFENCGITEYINSSTNIQTFSSCVVGSLTLSAGTLVFNYCTLGGQGGSVVLSGSVLSSYYFCRFNGANGSISGSSSSTTRIVNCSFFTAFQAAITVTSVLYYSGGTFARNAGDFFSSSTTPLLCPTIMGNVKNLKTISTTYTVLDTDQYLGISAISAPFTITLPNTGDISLKMSRGQTITIKDQSGTANINNVTVTTNGGTIDGATSFIINQNYESIDLLFDGTNYFIT